jgi:hypothetical protein
MITPEERQSIIDEVKKEIYASEERMMIILPDIFSNLVLDNKGQLGMTSKFYKDNKKFVGHENVVSAVIGEVDGKNPLLDYQEKLDKAVPLIKKRLKQMSGLNMKTVDSNPSREFTPISPATTGSNGKV